MSERMPQHQVDQIFKELLPGEIHVAEEPSIFALNELYRRLKSGGFTDDDIAAMFDLITPGGEDEI